uniref:p74_0 protein n=1 Tax=Fopius arisanus TaxID=64838 RepID=A0A0C9QYV0_9HYME
MVVEDGIITYTDDDRAAAYEFSKANYYIRLLQAMHKVRPNIISWLNVEIRDATQDDYYIPESLIGRAKVMTINMTKKACEMTSCTPVNETRPCRKTDLTSYYRIGESKFDVQCQASCFNTAFKPTYDTTNNQIPDTPQLRWHNNSCRIVNHSVDSWETKPRYRSDTQYEKRLNDLPIGFQQIPNSNPFGSGVSYKMDRAYCSFYELQYDESKNTCVTSLIDQIVGAVVGSSLLQNLKGGIKAAINNGELLTLPNYVEALPKDKLPTVDEWLSDVNANFTIPEIIDYTKPVSNRRQKRNISKDYEHPRLLLERRYKARQTPDRVINLKKRANNVENPRRTKRDANQETSSNNNDNVNEKTEESSTAQRLWEGLLEYLTSEENRLYVIADGSQLAWPVLKKLVIKLAEKLGPQIVKIVTKIPGTIGLRVIQTAIKTVASKVVSMSVFRIGAQITLFLGRMLAAAASVVGWILFAAFIFDLMFAFWDPLGYNNIFPSKLPGDTMWNGELALRQAFGRATADYEWEQFTKLLLDEETVFSIGLESIIDQALYLDSLVVNSEGSVIDKGDHVSFDGVDTTELEETNNIQRAKIHRFNGKQFEMYNEYFYYRAQVNKILQKIGYISVLIGGLLLLTQLKLVAFLCLLFAILILCFGSLLSLDNNDLVNFFYNSPIKFIKQN